MEMQDILPLAAVDAIIWSFTSFAVVVTILRLHTRIFIVKAFGLDDGLIIAGQLLALTLAAIAAWHTNLLYYVRRTIMENDFATIISITNIGKDADAMFFSGFLSEVFGFTTLPFIKCSILAFYKRIIPSRKQHMLLYAIAFVISVQALILLLVLIFTLDPPSAWLNFYTGGRKYKNPVNYLLINSVFQVFYDLILLLLPLPIIYKTNFRGRDRAGLIFVYILCFVSVVATSIRLAKVAEFSMLDNEIISLKARVHVTYWMVIEIMTALLCANIPAMPALFRRLARNRKSQSALAAAYSGKNSNNSSKCSGGKHLSAFTKPFRHKPLVRGKSEETKEHEPTWHTVVSELEHDTETVQVGGRCDSDTKESGHASQDSMSGYGIIDTPAHRTAQERRVAIGERVMSLLSFNRSRSPKSTSSVDEGLGKIYRTDRFDVERTNA